MLHFKQWWQVIKVVHICWEEGGSYFFLYIFLFFTCYFLFFSFFILYYFYLYIVLFNKIIILKNPVCHYLKYARTELPVGFQITNNTLFATELEQQFFWDLEAKSPSCKNTFYLIVSSQTGDTFQTKVILNSRQESSKFDSREFLNVYNVLDECNGPSAPAFCII